MRIRMLKKSDGLIPFDEEAERVISKFPHDGYVVCDVKQPRNVKHHRKFFAMVSEILFMLDENLSTEDVLMFIKDELGMYRVVAIGDKVLKEYDSISFAKMSQPEFDIFYEKAHGVCMDMIYKRIPERLDSFERIASFA